MFSRLAALLLLFLPSANFAGTPTQTPIGAYRWANGTENLDAFATWIKRPDVWGVDFIGSESWDNVQWPTWWLEKWGPWVNAKPGRRLILAVPILPGPADGSGPKQGKIDPNVPVSLEKGAAGDYNHHYKQLAENLVKYRLTNTILRPGWEFNGGWYTWKAKDKTAAFAEYWRQIVKTMRAVPGAEKLQFCWNPTLGDQQFPAEQAWPGDEYVDYVGLDVYDETWNQDTYPWPAGTSETDIEARQKKVWDEWLYGSRWGIAFWSKFARDHQKPLAFPEWGVNFREDGHGGQDNAYFIERMQEIIQGKAHGVAWHAYFDVNAPDGHHQLSPGVGEKGEPVAQRFPKAAQRFLDLFTRWQL